MPHPNGGLPHMAAKIEHLEGTEFQKSRFHPP